MTSKNTADNKSPVLSSGSGIAPWLGVAAIIVLIDQVTKIMVARMLTYGDSRPVTSFFNIVLAHNEGAAFSFLAAQGGWQRYLFSGIAIAATVFIIYLLKKHSGQRLFSWALALVLGGALGNLVDRIAYGYVIDFLDFHVGGWHWPAFNFADCTICIGAVLFVVDELRRVRK